LGKGLELAPSGGSSPSGGPTDAGALVAAAFHGTAALLLVIGAEGRVLVVNPAMTRATGWTKTELASRPFWQVYVAPEEAEQAQADFTAAVGAARSPCR
jgi:PAS domain S-box-containing protein